MTVIVNSAFYRSKAALKIALDGGKVLIHEPSIMGSWSKLSKDIEVGYYATCTNEKRLKFCIIQKLSASNWKVE